MTSEGLGEMFEGDSADMCAGKFPLVSMGGQAEGLACTDPGSRTPIGASGNFFLFVYLGYVLVEFKLKICKEKLSTYYPQPKFSRAKKIYEN
jgi:hypothetical protein